MCLLSLRYSFRGWGEEVVGTLHVALKAFTITPVPLCRSLHLVCMGVNTKAVMAAQRTQRLGTNEQAIRIRVDERGPQ